MGMRIIFEKWYGYSDISTLGSKHITVMEVLPGTFAKLYNALILISMLANGGAIEVYMKNLSRVQ